jgi:hypothetical protein
MGVPHGRDLRRTNAFCLFFVCTGTDRQQLIDRLYVRMWIAETVEGKEWLEESGVGFYEGECNDIMVSDSWVVSHCFRSRV